MKIYADPITVNCRKVLAGLELIGAPYQREHVDYFKGEQKLPGYVAMNPNAAIPAMVDGDFVLWESNTIIRYLANKWRATSLLPSEPRARAEVERWIDLSGQRETISTSGKYFPTRSKIGSRVSS